MCTVLGDRIVTMSRRRNRRSGQGGPLVWPSVRQALPLPDEYPRRVFVESSSPGLPVRLWQRSPRLSLARQVLSRPVVGRDAERRYGLAARWSFRDVFPPRSVAFRTPRRVLLCVRRGVRREVLFALRKAGYGGSAPKRHYRRTSDSYYHCGR